MIISWEYFSSNAITKIAGIDTLSDGKHSEVARKKISEIEDYIRVYEPMFLTALLGVAYKDVLIEHPKMIDDLRDEENKISPIANFVYFMYMRDNITMATIAGEREKTVQGSMPASPNARLITAWNLMTDMIYGFIDKYDDIIPPNRDHSIFFPVNDFNL